MLSWRPACVFSCPWTGRELRTPRDYDLDHLVPIALIPINELWNIAPADPPFNSHIKRDRLPSPGRLAAARPRLAAVFRGYLASGTLSPALAEDAALRF